MKRWSVLLLSLLALALPSAAGAADLLLPDGGVYRSSGDGIYHWIPDVATANALGVDGNELELVDELPGPAGEPLPVVQTRTVLGALAATPVVPRRHVDALILASGDVYELAADGSCSLIPDVATANALGVDWDNLQSVDELPC